MKKHEIPPKPEIPPCRTIREDVSSLIIFAYVCLCIVAVLLTIAWIVYDYKGDEMIQERAQKVNELLKDVKSHCMCLDFEEDSTHYMVIHPEGYYPQGIRVEKAMGKANALLLLLDRMEQHWQESLFWKHQYKKNI